MAQKKIKTVTSRKTDAGTVYDFTCPFPTGCGLDANDPDSRFTTSDWANRADAAERGKQHVAEHTDGTPMPSLDEFRKARGLTAETAVPAAPNPDDVEY